MQNLAQWAQVGRESHELQSYKLVFQVHRAQSLVDGRQNPKGSSQRAETEVPMLSPMGTVRTAAREGVRY